MSMQNNKKSKNTSLIIVTGLAGSGKTTLSKQIAKERALPYFDYDTLTEPFLQRLHSDVYPEKDYAGFCAEWRNESYAIFFNTIAENLKLGINVVASAPCTRELTMNTFISRFKQQHGISELTTINFHLVPTETRLRTLIQQRNLVRDDYHLTYWNEFYATQSKTDPVWDCDVVVPIHFTKSETPLARSTEVLRRYF